MIIYTWKDVFNRKDIMKVVNKYHNKENPWLKIHIQSSRCGFAQLDNHVSPIACNNEKLTSLKFIFSLMHDNKVSKNKKTVLNSTATIVTSTAKWNSATDVVASFCFCYFLIIRIMWVTIVSML